MFDTWRPPLQPDEPNTERPKPHFVFLAHNVKTTEARLREMERWSNAVEPGRPQETVAPTVMDLRTELHLLVPGLQISSRDILDGLPHSSLFRLVEILVLHLIGNYDRDAAAWRALEEVGMFIEREREKLASMERRRENAAERIQRTARGEAWMRRKKRRIRKILRGDEGGEGKEEEEEEEDAEEVGGAKSPNIFDIMEESLQRKELRI